MEYFVAKSYQNYDYDTTKAYKKSGKLYVSASCKCGRCVNGVFVSRIENGQPVPHPNANGVCFQCGGSGVIRKEVRLYTESEYNAAQKASERAKAKKEEEAAAARKKLVEDSEKNKKEWWTKNGVGEDGLIWIVFGDTYAVKERLKELGCRFSPVLKWYSPVPIEVPAGCGLLSIPFDEVYEWNPHMKNAFFYEDAQKKVEKLIQVAEGPSNSEYVGTVGERLRNITVRYDSTRGFMSKWGYNFIYQFKIGENILIWITQKELNFKAGDVVDLTGTIKEHQEYNAVKQTYLTRCIIKKIC